MARHPFSRPHLSPIGLAFLVVQEHQLLIFLLLRTECQASMFVHLHIPTCAIKFNASLVHFFTPRIVILNKTEAVVALSVSASPTFCELKV